jgi:hypothetical protein
MSHADDIDDAFMPRLHAIAGELGAQAIDMLAVMMSESGVRADAHNDGPPGVPDERRYHASGLIQFMPATLPGVGWTAGHAAFRQLSATAQLDYVRRYYLPHRGHLGSVGGLYVATFLPVLTRHAGDPSFVLTAKDGPLGWAYAPNAVFDTNHDLAITVGELEQAVARNCRGPRWSELASRCAGQYVPPVADADAPDLRTTFGIQAALERLGHDPGKLDGIPGPRTMAAVVAFQTARGLKADGIVGPLTRAALLAALTFEH